MPKYRVVLVTDMAAEFPTRYFEATREQNHLTSIMVGEMVTQIHNIDHIRFEDEAGEVIRTVSVETNIQQWLEVFDKRAG